MYHHDFGSFHETIKVDGTVYAFEEYAKLPGDARLALREEAVNRCVQANQASTAAWAELIRPIREKYQAKSKALKSKGRARRFEEGALRAQERREIGLLRSPGLIDGCTYPAALHDVFYVWEQKVETPWEKFERMVTHFDWYYEYSDDHSVWSSGNYRHNQIRRLIEELGPEAQALYNKCCPWRNDDGSLKENH